MKLFITSNKKLYVYISNVSNFYEGRSCLHYIELRATYTILSSITHRAAPTAVTVMVDGYLASRL